MQCLHKRIGQSMVELSFVVLAVIAGIVIGGPYLLDSLNSHFKLWDTAVGDSSNDRLVQAHDVGINTASVGACTFKNKAPGSCAIRECATSAFPLGAPTLRYYTWQYTPVGCQIKFTCEPDPTCCAIPKDLSICWRIGDPNNETRTWALPDEIPPEDRAKGFHSCAPNGTACVNGDILYELDCGNKVMFMALHDLVKCRPTCNWEKIPSNATPCPGQGNVSFMPISKNPDLLLPSNLCSCDPGACQAKCASGTFPLNGECVCSCPANQVAVRTCDANSCYQGSCQAGYCSINMNIGCAVAPPS